MRVKADTSCRADIGPGYHGRAALAVCLLCLLFSAPMALAQSDSGSRLVRLTDAVPNAQAEPVMARVGLENRRSFPLPHRSKREISGSDTRISLSDVVNVDSIGPDALGLYVRFQRPVGDRMARGYQFVDLESVRTGEARDRIFVELPGALGTVSTDSSIESMATEVLPWPHVVRSARVRVREDMQLQVGLGFLEPVPRADAQAVHFTIRAHSLSGTRTLYEAEHIPPTPRTYFRRGWHDISVDVGDLAGQNGPSSS